jgi:hypothetical protein
MHAAIHALKQTDLGYIPVLVFMTDGEGSGE